MGPQDPKDVARDTARDLSGMAGELAARRPTPATGSPIRSTQAASAPGNAHAAVEAALIEARRRVRLNEGRES